MKILAEYGKEGIARVFIGKNRNSNKHLVEFVESFQRPLSIDQKWVIIVSTLYGCPGRCLMCDAGWFYFGKLTAQEILQQIDYIVKKRFPNKQIPSREFKIQFARMGEPALNPAVLEVLRNLPNRFYAPGLLPCISTVAPSNCNHFFEELLKIKNEFYNRGNFQFQFSIHTTDPKIRNKLIPIKKWGLEDISDYGEKFYQNGDKKIALNFAVMKGCPINPKVIKEHFDPEKFILKFTPLNPTEKVKRYGLKSTISSAAPSDIQELFKEFNSYGFETILSIGDLEENNIGSNCGQILIANNLWRKTNG